MKIDIVIALVCAAVSAMALAFIFVRGVLGTAGGVKQSGSSLRTVLAPIALFIEHRRSRDQELNRTLERLEKLVVQSGGRFMEGATAGEVFAARFVLPLATFAGIMLFCALLRLSGGLAFMAAVFFAVLMYAYPESGLKAAAEERTRRFTRDLPGALDVMRLVAQSGGDLLSAIRAVIDVMPGGPVRDELSPFSRLSRNRWRWARPWRRTCRARRSSSATPRA